MTETDTVAALAALAQPHRLRAFRALVVAGPEGLTPGDLVNQLGVAGNALSFHLRTLAQAGLVHAEPRGRHLIYRADYARMNALLGYLTEHCCSGQLCAVPGADATGTPACC